MEYFNSLTHIMRRIDFSCVDTRTCMPYVYIQGCAAFIFSYLHFCKCILCKW